jgi:2-iminobutanoate/2-iminopropanoate deaminase
MKEIHTVDAPKPIGPYSQAIEHHGTIYISGQLGIDPDSGKLAGDGIEEQTHQIMKNIKAILKEGRYDFHDVMKFTIYLTDLKQFPKVNKIYGQYLSEPYPARATIGVASLPMGALVEIEACGKK